MPTENSKLIPGELFFKDEEGKIQKLRELQQFEIKLDEKADAVDAMRYYVESMKKFTTEDSIEMEISKESARMMRKMLGIETITRKRFIKLLMGCGIQRNQATMLAMLVNKNKLRYTPSLVQYIIEKIMEMIEVVEKYKRR